MLSWQESSSHKQTTSQLHCDLFPSSLRMLYRSARRSKIVVHVRRRQLQLQPRQSFLCPALLPCSMGVLGHFVGCHSHFYLSTSLIWTLSWQQEIQADAVSMEAAMAPKLLQMVLVQFGRHRPAARRVAQAGRNLQAVASKWSHRRQSKIGNLGMPRFCKHPSCDFFWYNVACSKAMLFLMRPQPQLSK